LKIRPEKFEPFPIHQLMGIEFSKESGLKQVFQNLASGKQKEYILYLNEAKQEATKLKRLEKIVMLIRNGTCPNDQYK